MSIAEPAQHFSRESSPVAGGYFTSPNEEWYNTEQLNLLHLTELQTYANDVHHLACKAQEGSRSEDRDGEGFCNESIRRVKLLKEVLQFSANKGTLIDDSVGAYQWHPKYGDGPAEAFDKIKARFLFPLPTLAENTNPTDGQGPSELSHP